MRAGILMLAAAPGLTFAADDAVNPQLSAKPVLEVRAGQAVTAAPSGTIGSADVAARIGVAAKRRALTARATLGVYGDWIYAPAEQAAGTATTPYLSEAWIGLNPEISESLVVQTWVGRQALQFHEGRILGTGDRNLRGDFLDVARVSLLAAPWQLEVLAGADADPAGTHSAPIPGERPAIPMMLTPVLFARAGASRESPSATWVANAVYALSDADRDGSDEHTLGAYVRANAGRVRSRIDAYVQPFPTESAWLGGAELGWAIGDDARVVLGLRGEGRSGNGASTRPFGRPWHDAGGDFGWMNLWEPGSARGDDGLASAGLFTEATVVPSLRIQAAAQHAVAIESSFAAAQLQADIRWWLTPLSAIHVRSAVFAPYSSDESVLSSTTISLDLAL